jgi:hypothetical protein
MEVTRHKLTASPVISLELLVLMEHLAIQDERLQTSRLVYSFVILNLKKCQLIPEFALYVGMCGTCVIHRRSVVMANTAVFG